MQQVEDHVAGAHRPPPGGRLRRPLLWVAVCACLTLSGLIVVNTLAYFSFGQDFAFLVEKGVVARNAMWSACFYLHIAGGMLCLVTGPLLIWNGLTRRSIRAHRWLGRAYATAVLGWAGPTGLYLALFAKGGIVSQIGFVLLGVLWYAATVLGMRAIRAGRVTEHVCWMLRSYALALSAVFFRLIQVAFYLTGLHDEPNYILSLWLSNAVSLWVGECMALRFVSLNQVDPAQAGAAVRGFS